MSAVWNWVRFVRGANSGMQIFLQDVVPDDAAEDQRTCRLHGNEVPLCIDDFAVSREDVRVCLNIGQYLALKVMKHHHELRDDGMRVVARIPDERLRISLSSGDMNTSVARARAMSLKSFELAV